MRHFVNKQAAAHRRVEGIGRGFLQFCHRNNIWHKVCRGEDVQTIILSPTITKLQVMMKPIGDRVVIKPAPAEEKTKGGIIIPDTAKEKPQRGEVVAVGPGKDGNLMTVQVGDIVLYGKYAGQEINFNGEDFMIMREDDVLVIL